MTGDKSRWAAFGGVGTALGAGVCCVGPPLAAAGLVGAAGVAYAVEPLRPVFLILAAGFLALAFRLAQKRAACDADVCRNERGRPRPPWLLWLATGIAIVFASLPLLLELLR